MRKTFREWYAPTTGELGRLWREAFVVLDSSVLLGLYQYPPASVDEFFAVLEGLGARLWIPHQAGLEYQKGREGRIPEQRLVLDRVLREIDELASRLESLAVPEFHPTLALDEFEKERASVRQNLARMADPVRRARESTPDIAPGEILIADHLFDRITALFSDKVGEPFSEAEMHSVYEEGARRYEAEVPPGFKDRDKQGTAQFGDLLLWKQILRMAKGSAGTEPRSVIFVTNDRKEDWWRRRQNVIVGPRTELVREYIDAVGTDFFMYTPASFLQSAREQLTAPVSEETIQNVQRISSASRVTALLRFQRMVVPEPRSRGVALGEIYEGVRSGKMRIADDLNVTISSLGDVYRSNFVAVPLFFSLINQAYGPIQIDTNPLIRLRDRSVVEVRFQETRELFVEAAHAAWIAQALYRLRFERFGDDELLVGLFGEDFPVESAAILRRAKELVELDIAFRGSGHPESEHAG